MSNPPEQVVVMVHINRRCAAASREAEKSEQKTIDLIFELSVERARTAWQMNNQALARSVNPNPRQRIHPPVSESTH
eukprot:637938-Prorocentrum_minimum.AAC.5